METQNKVLEVRNLKTYFHMFEGLGKAVNDVSFHVRKGEVLGIVGESGCGKSVACNSIMRLIPEPPGEIAGGQILFDGQDLTKLSTKEMMGIRGNRISMIFQEPMTSLNPIFTIGDQVSEVFQKHLNLSKKESLDRAVEMLRIVQIPSPEQRVKDYPFQMSGGIRQRVMIAMALACNPEVLIADEPTTALDVTIQAQILDLMMNLRHKYNTGIIMITHDLGVIAEIASRIVVMYAGQVIEEGSTRDIFNNPLHPYTLGLLEAIPKLRKRSRQGNYRLNDIPGIVPGLLDPIKGCKFRPRCNQAHEGCTEDVPDLVEISDGHRVRCCRYAA